MPALILVAGPNGAGESTCADQLLRHHFGLVEFVNGDLIAAGISPFKPEGVAMQAGRILLQRVQELVSHNEDFAVETTL